MRKPSLPGLFLGALLLCGPLPAGATESEELTQMKASRKAVAAACAVIKGLAVGTTARAGPYGCISEGGWITCDEQGFCIGARDGHGAARLGPRRGSDRSS